MPSFPRLSTGAITQYPVQATQQQAVQILPFVDGRDQRFLRRGRQLRRWEIQLDFLTQSELYAFEDFFKDRLGSYMPFDFVDPFTNLIVPGCVFGNALVLGEYLASRRHGLAAWIVETNG